ncbi:MAG: threonine--tRNA ligase [Candidatus Buchananbacteria bacterium RIFCSPHIGHO2_01_FULL_39_14]|uniref:Threonine--tRNA ligase n=1 Tax=Candidatus Buchananbacteria bacterium RIFCSPHIGHO2_01_FULL_39_14 TaxID=1797532 RepID=A0A1G1XXJ8_9BACT|nr:MAG: threonine--tRNA ligase [Candidatus Buchananbacteria bacterium RIFCSPHIGHO2_01_FULL_39_14]OGY49467.1 MAG: threonine--tRNA ligase [Candidatus Buchananbacteria bacterium RIFCSPHIGHO2_02_FULL_39_17]
MSKNLESIRHSASHVLAQAVLERYPQAKLAIGPAIDTGFYYDFDLGGKTFTEADLDWLEKKMREIIKQNQKMEQSEMTAEEAIKFFKTKKQPYKVELAMEFKKQGEKKVGLNKMIDHSGKEKFIDLCAGGHINLTKEIGAIKLLKIAGAYWRGDEKNKMLQRIYGTAFTSEKELNDYLEQLKQAEERDHRKLGQELDLFTFSDLVGGGLPMFTPRGTIIRNEIENYLTELQIPRGYQKVWIPHLAKKELYQVSGHWDKFGDDIFHVASKGEEIFVLKPMNCPHHTQIYASRQRSYRELPIRYFEVTAMYRDEKAGQLHGLSRVRSITIDDAHCFCRYDQIEQEVNLIYDIIAEFYRTFKMELIPRLSLSDPKNPDKYIGERRVWAKAEDQLRRILKKRVKHFEEIEGEAAFYGPKIDFEAKDSIGRKWQLATIQLDFNMPNRFQLEYIDEKGERVQPVMIHQAVAGSFERFLSILIENYAGAFPLWLAPVQVQIIPVSKDFFQAAAELTSELENSGIRVWLDDLNETVGYKIRKGEKQKVPYMLVIGEKEAKSKNLNVRIRGQKEVATVNRKKFIEQVAKEIKEKK